MTDMKGEDAPPFGHHGDAHLDDVVGVGAVDPLALEMDFAGVDFPEPGDRAQDGRLARAIGPDEGDGLTLVEVE